MMRSETRGDAPDPRSRRPSLSRKLLVSVLGTGVLLGAVELVLALAGVRPVLLDEDPYVGFSSRVPLFEERTAADGTVRRVTAPNKLAFFNAQELAVPKPAGAFRIFCVGGSTTYGRPYDDRTSFCGWLRAFLPAADPTREWEVVNAGGISYASFRVAMLMEELIAYEPDLFVVYSGQNEFLERRTYAEILAQPPLARWLGAAVTRTRIGTVARRGVLALRAGNGGGKGEGGRAMLAAEVETRLDDVVGPDDYERDDATAARVVEHYRHNLSRMADVARAGGAEILYVTPASNLRDCSPFKSQHRDGWSDADEARFADAMQRGTAALDGGRFADAVAAFDAALALDDRYAAAHYLRGRALDAAGRSTEAKLAFERAVDEDVCPLRALSAMRPVPAEVSAARSALHVDFAALAEGWSADGIPGEDLFLDHVHPTIDGHRRLALAILQRLVDGGIVQPSPEWNEETRARVAAVVEGGLDDATQAKALLNLSKVFGWAGKHDEAARQARRALELAPADAEIHLNLGIALWSAGEEERAMEHYRSVLAVEPGHADANHNLGLGLLRRGETEAAIEHCRRAVTTDPSHRKAWGSLGDALSRAGRWDDAIAAYDEAVELGTRDAQIHNGLGKALCKIGRLEEGLAAFRSALELDPDSVHVRSNFGRALCRFGDVEAGAAQFRRALELDPESADAHYDLAQIAWGEGQTDEGLTHAREAVRLRPEHAGSRALLGTLHLERERYDEARDELERALALQVAEPMATRSLAWLLASCPEDALRDGARALELAERLPRAAGGAAAADLDVLAAAYAETGRFEEAIEAATTARKLAQRAGAPVAREIRRRLESYEAGRAWRLGQRP